MTTAARVHKETAREAGFGSLSAVSVAAGVLASYGAFAVVAAIAGAILTSIDVNTEFRTNDWTGSGATAMVITAGVLLVAYLFGGYVAGRMARRSGMVHGLLVAIVSLIVGGIAGAVVRALSDSAQVEQNLRSIGMPVTTNQISDVAIAGAVLSLVAVLVGAVVGGMLGERWHTKLAERVADPDIGPGAQVRAQALREEEARQARLTANDPVSRDMDARHDLDLRDGRDADPRLTAAEWRAQESAAVDGGGVRRF